jgi:hypothetical protein
MYWCVVCTELTCGANYGLSYVSHYKTFQLKGRFGYWNYVMCNRHFVRSEVCPLLYIQIGWISASHWRCACNSCPFCGHVGFEDLKCVVMKISILLKQPHSLRPVWSSYIYCLHTPLHVSVFLVNHLQKAHQLFKGNYHYMIHSYIK